MRRLVLTTAVMLASQMVRAEGNLTLPWDEFKTLYNDKIQRQFESNQSAKSHQTLLSIDEANYKVSIVDDQAIIEVTIQGSHLRGEPEPIVLFDHHVAIRDIHSVEGGAIISDKKGYLFVVEAGGQKNFQASLSLIVSLTAERQLQSLSFSIPTAVRNVLDVELPLDTELIEHPGIRQSLQRYYFSPQDKLSLSFANRQQRQQLPVDIETFTRVELQADRYIFTLNCLPDRLSRSDLELAFRQPLRYLDSSLPGAAVSFSKKNTLLIANEENKAFVLRFEVDAKELLSDLLLPHFLNNTEIENSLQIVDPLAAEIRLITKDPARQISLTELPQNLPLANAMEGNFYRLESEDSFGLNLKRFNTVQTPEVVLDSLYFYSSFSDNGNQISVLRMEVPEGSGDRLEIKPIAGAEIWSLMVNGEKKQVYSQLNEGQDPTWILPISNDADSLIELTYLQRHAKLGLEGQLAIDLPETGLAADKVFVTIGLVERLELVAVEGDLTPAENEQCPTVTSFTGTGYIFQYPFYNGQAIEAAIYYKEPLEENHS